ncbi:hypothetical protein GCM10010353_06360 [Streptomyces chryseus]|nr:hypothetical protein GCM10010353_06360 [Streptomyces chryseus]
MERSQTVREWQQIVNIAQAEDGHEVNENVTQAPRVISRPLNLPGKRVLITRRRLLSPKTGLRTTSGAFSTW